MWKQGTNNLMKLHWVCIVNIWEYGGSINSKW